LFQERFLNTHMWNVAVKVLKALYVMRWTPLGK
jgi:hypothetical protein